MRLVNQKNNHVEIVLMNIKCATLIGFCQKNILFDKYQDLFHIFYVSTATPTQSLDIILLYKLLSRVHIKTVI